MSCSDATHCNAVGEDGNEQPIYATETAGSWSAAVELPVTGTGGFSDVSCAAAGSCEAVGAGSGGTLYAVETAGVWSSTTVLSEPDGWDGTIASCASVGNCTVAGLEGSPGTTAVLVETNGAWGTPGPLPAQLATQVTGSHVTFGAISCSDAADCTADGWSPATWKSYALTETAGVWSTFTALSGPPGGYAFVGDVSCTAPGDCTAVGYGGNEAYEGGPLEYTDQPMESTETNGTWSALSLQTDPAGAGGLGAVSCSAPSDCTAVGTDTGSQPIYSIETSGGWSAPTEVPLGAPATGSLSAVSCPAAGYCTAVGTDSNGFPIYATETAGTWEPLAQLATPTTGTGSFHGISCSSAGNCTAVGEDEIFSMYATETNGVWAAPGLILGGMDGPLNAVSCSGAGNCTAVGEDANSQPQYVTESGGTWGAPTELAVSGGTGSFASVSCTSATNCTAAGTDGNGQPLYATETNGTWSTPLQVAAAAETKITSVTCSSAGNCTAVGYGTANGGNGPLTYDTQTAGSWATPTELTANGSPAAGQLSGVSCVDTSDCTAVGDAAASSSSTGTPIYVTETAGAWGSPAAVSGTPGGTGDFEGVSCTGASACTAVGVDGNGEPIFTTSDAANVAPAVTTVAPVAGPTSGGTSVTITGTGFTGATGVTFGGFAATNVDVVDATTITATSPGYAAGTHSVQVITPAGTSAKVAGSNFTYEGTPAVTAVSPEAGPTSGGTSVTITGAGFLGATGVTFGGFAASHVVVVNATTITATSPGYAAGTHSVQVTTLAGTSAKVAASNFTYQTSPTVSALLRSATTSGSGDPRRAELIATCHFVSGRARISQRRREA